MQHIDFSIIIPTYNGENTIGTLLKKLSHMQNKHTCEVIIIDSSSDDHTEKVSKSFQNKFESFKFINIKREDFNHGKTRNLGVKQARGTYICFFSQDVNPISQRIFTKLYEDFKLNKRIAIVYGKQIPYETTPYIQQLDQLCLNLAKEEYLDSSSRTLYDKKNPSLSYTESNYYLWYELSNAFSCYKASYLKKYPFLTTDYGEDMQKAHEIIESNLIKLYDARVIVQHSHSLTVLQYWKRLRKDYLVRSKLQKLSYPKNLSCKLKLIANYDKPIVIKIYNYLLLIFSYFYKTVILISIQFGQT